MKRAPTREPPPRPKRKMFGTRIKIMWEEQLVDPPIDSIIL